MDLRFVPSVARFVGNVIRLEGVRERGMPRIGRLYPVAEKRPRLGRLYKLRGSVEDGREGEGQAGDQGEDR